MVSEELQHDILLIVATVLFVLLAIPVFAEETSTPTVIA
ncbi:hypothetical protein HM1_0651 [Heliomicrobium modesticaldum Ice1]|uniref:Uncharacterized protein n=1 Tax=Heliobacterium modesticaldum (strain ATCC 51547 / Ice1) TaxID=498761 RepID=B0TBR2_HELMI|nr:hypothetical protein HM1_0651 [Heliomicrobium modesticaldum Ice1]